MATGSDGEPPVRLRGLTGYRYLLAVMVLVALATVPMVLAVAAGNATLDRSPAPTLEPFIPPVDHREYAEPGLPDSGNHQLTARADDAGWCRRRYG
jgi:hypothetical protein